MFEDVIQDVAPFSPPLHHAGCGCPSDKSQLKGPAVDAVVQRAYALYHDRLLEPNRKLKVGILVSSAFNDEEAGPLIDHVHELHCLGHVTVILVDSVRQKVPSWLPQFVGTVEFLDPRCTFAEATKWLALDVVLVGCLDQVADALGQASFPVVYWEQGNNLAWNSPVGFSLSGDPRLNRLFHSSMNLPVALSCASTQIGRKLNSCFNRFASVVRCGVDCKRYQPGPRQPPLSSIVNTDMQETRSILLVGDPLCARHGMGVAMAVLLSLEGDYLFQVRWIVPLAISRKLLPVPASNKIRIEYCINPPEVSLPPLFQGHDAFLHTRSHDGTGRALMQAMASGLAVVSTDCLGHDAFLQPDVNACVSDNLLGLSSSLKLVLSDNQLRARLQSAARLSAERCLTQSGATRDLEAVLYSVVATADIQEAARCDSAHLICQTRIIAARLRKPAQTPEVTAPLAPSIVAVSEPPQSSVFPWQISSYSSSPTNRSSVVGGCDSALPEYGQHSSTLAGSPGPSGTVSTSWPSGTVSTSWPMFDATQQFQAARPGLQPGDYGAGMGWGHSGGAALDHHAIDSWMQEVEKRVLPAASGNTLGGSFTPNCPPAVDFGDFNDFDFVSAGAWA